MTLTDRAPSGRRRACRVGSVAMGDGQPLVVIAGPCVLEHSGTNERIGRFLVELCTRLGLPLIFKASFDKANRTSVRSPRGPGLERGLEELARLRDLLGVPVTTDIHEPGQA